MRLLQIAFFNNVHMPQLMTGDMVSEGAHAGTVSVCDASSHQGCVVQAIDESNCRLPHRGKFIEQIVDRARRPRGGRGFP
jgi:hypothetical protein